MRHSALQLGKFDSNELGGIRNSSHLDWKAMCDRFLASPQLWGLIGAKQPESARAFPQGW